MKNTTDRLLYELWIPIIIIVSIFTIAWVVSKFI